MNDKKQIQYLPLSELKPYENNPRKNDEAVEYVAKSIQEFGFKVPIVIDKNGVIVAGHTRYKAAKEIGMEAVPCIVADDLTEEQVKAFRLADNKVSDFSIWDNKKLLEELDSINDDMFTGFAEGGVFDSVLNELDQDIIADNTDGVTYEAVFKSPDKEIIDKITKEWERMTQNDGQSSGG